MDTPSHIGLYKYTIGLQITQMQCQNMNESWCSDECGGNVPDMREVGPVVELAQITRIEDLSLGGLSYMVSCIVESHEDFLHQH